MSSAPVDLDHLRQWVGRAITAVQFLDPFAARALAGLLDRGEAPGEGDALPLPWHWLYFLDAPSRECTGADGHPKRGDFLPTVPLPRRMWASGEMEIRQPLLLGRPARKTSTVRSVDLKQGKAGSLVFVTVVHELEQGGQACISELQHIVYREAPTAPAPLPPGEAAPKEAAWSRTLLADPRRWCWTWLRASGQTRNRRGSASARSALPSTLIRCACAAGLRRMVHSSGPRIPPAYSA